MTLVDIADSLERLDETTVDLVRAALAQGEEPVAIIQQGIVAGIRRCGEKLAAYEYGVPELMVAGEMAQECIEVVRPHLDAAGAAPKATVVLASVQGDIHELGKNLVALFLELEGYSVVDLGVDVPPMTIIEKAVEVGAVVIGLSSLMVTTMPAQQELLTYLRDMGLRERFQVVVGGAPVTEQWADSIGADGWAADGAGAVRLVERLLAGPGAAGGAAAGPTEQPDGSSGSSQRGAQS